MSKMSSTELMCGKKPASNPKEVSKFHADCSTYRKCDHKKCNDSDLKLRAEFTKIPIEKSLKIVQKCMQKKGNEKQLCSFNEQKKLSPKIKKLVEDVESCRNEKCKNESENMLKSANILLSSKEMKTPMKDIMKGIKMIRKSKTLKKIMQKKLKSMYKSYISKNKKRTHRK
jgi:hypothetical protein